MNNRNVCYYEARPTCYQFLSENGNPQRMRRKKQREIEPCNINLSEPDTDRYIHRVALAISEYHSKHFYFERPPPRIIASVNVPMEVSSYLNRALVSC